MNKAKLIALLRKHPFTIGGAVFSLAFALALYFRSDATAEAEAELAEKTALGERLALNIKYSAQLAEQSAALTTAMSTIERQIIQAGQVGANTQYFYKIEADTGAKITDLRQTTPPVAAAPAKGAFAPVAFALSVQGDLPQVLGFLRQVESGAHYSRILAASCSADMATRSGPLTLALTLELLGRP